jgi:hypothetical protein
MKEDKETASKRAASAEAAKDASDNEEAVVSPIAGQEGFKTPARADKNRRKSGAGSAAKGKSLSKKASRATLTNLDAQPGDQFLVKLKGFPPWPVIVADESMLPEILTSHRPVSAMKADGTWNEPFADGGKRVHERKLPIMYLHTNEFGWTQNTMLQPLSAERAEEALAQGSKMKKDLKLAFELATKDNSLDYYKDLLTSYQQALAKEQEREEVRAQAAKAKSKKSKASGDGDGDLDMPDDQPEDESEDAKSKSSKSKKRKADEDVSTPQRTDSVKKPKIKLTATATPKSADAKSATKQESSKDIKVKLKKSSSKDEKKDKEASGSKGADMPPENKKKREVLFLRHRIQRGLLTKDSDPKAEEMPSMSDHLAKLENHYPDLEVGIMRETKINKVLKAILKLDDIPRDAEFKLKERSATLLDKWNKLLAADFGAPASNGVGKESDDKAAEGTEATGSKDVEMPDRTKEDSAEAAKPAEAETAEAA